MLQTLLYQLNPRYVCLRHFIISAPLNTNDSNEWFKRQTSDRFVKQARKDSYRCRSAYKLIDIDSKCRIFKPGYHVIDCGAAPGSWSQVAVEKVNADGRDNTNLVGSVLAVDLLFINPIKGVSIFNEKDFTNTQVQSLLLAELNTGKADVLLSDMSPSPSGIKSLDHSKSVELCFSLLRFSLDSLRENGSLVMKLLDGERRTDLLSRMEKCFRKVQVVRSIATRTNSSEIYLVGQQFDLGRTS